jgi:hypothetical protein
VRRGSRHNLSRAEYLSGMAYAYARRGTELPHARLNPELVRAIRADERPAATIARELSVHPNTVLRVRRFETWGHV